MSNEESQLDAVKEARELLGKHERVNAINLTNSCKYADHKGCVRDWCCCVCHDKFDARAPELLSALINEVERLQGERDGLDAAVTVQAESIIEFQSQLRVMKEAIEAAQTWIRKFKALDHNAFHAFNQGFGWEKCNERTCQKALALVNQLRSAITPKGSEQ